MSIKYNHVTHIYNPSTPYPYTAIHDIDVEIEEGIFTAIIGETGSGKSTLVQHLNALLLPNEGTVEVDEYTIVSDKKENKQLKKLRQHVGFVFQFPEYQLFEETVLKDVCFGPKNFGMDEEEATQKAKDALNIVGIDESYYERSPFELSGGQKRRVAIAGILAADPDILVLDEPTAGLDPQGAYDMMQLFKRLNEEMGKTIIMVTHDMEHVLNYCKQVIVMEQGEIKYKMSVDEFFQNDGLLASLNITPPYVIRTKQLLAQKGMHLEGNIINMNSLVEAIKKAVMDRG